MKTTVEEIKMALIQEMMKTGAVNITAQRLDEMAQLCYVFYMQGVEDAMKLATQSMTNEQQTKENSKKGSR